MATPYALTANTHVLVVDDEQGIRDMLSEVLGLEGYPVMVAARGEEAREILETSQVDILITDLEMPGMHGLDLLRTAAAINPTPVSIVMTGFATTESAIESIRLGAFDYLLKPFKLEQVLNTVEKALHQHRINLENAQLRQSESLYKLTEISSLRTDLDDLLNVIVETARVELDADAVAFVIEEPDRPGKFALRTASAKHDETDLIALANLQDRDRIMDAHATNTPLLASDEACQVWLAPSDDMRVYSFLSVPARSQGKLLGMLNAFSLSPTNRFTEGQRKIASIFATRAAVSVDNTYLFGDLEDSFTQTIQSLAHALEAKDQYSRGHSERVKDVAMAIAEEVGFSGPQLDIISRGAMLHDIGKIGMRYEALSRPGRLTPLEYEQFKAHPVLGRKILEPIKHMANIWPMAYYHHERYDGNGYPEALAGDDIPFDARIICLADAFEVMTTDRAYRRRLSDEQVMAELTRCRGTQFDPSVVDALISVIERTGLGMTTDEEWSLSDEDSMSQVIHAGSD